MRRFLGLLLALLMIAPASVWASTTGAIAGRVLSLDGAPTAKSVWVAGPGSSSPLASVPVKADGSFRAEGLPPGPVSLAVETTNGLYTVESPVSIAPGTTRTVGVALRGRQDTQPAEPPEKKKKKGTGIWNNPLTASLIVIGGAIIIGVIIDQATKNKNNTPVSPSVPGN